MQITLEAIEQEVRKLASENPDFIYTNQEGVPEKVGGSCSYLAAVDYTTYEIFQEDGKFPEDLSYDDARKQGLLGNRCIVGQALHNLGVDDDFLESHEGIGADFLVGNLTQRVKGAPKPLTQMWLAYVQGLQDEGNPWGEAVKIADKEYPNV